jgi:NADPH:quinone reductase-like Zn-dependent oxidoreductase
MSRAVIYEAFGGPEVLQVREVAEPHAGPGEVRVRVTAAGLNPMDWLIPSRPEAAAQFGLTLPSGFGYDFAGVIDEVGEGAAGFARGDRVYGGALARAVADFVVVKASAEGPRRSGRPLTALATRWRPRSRWPAPPPPPRWRRSASGPATPS